ncbi:quinoprotein relay system zinc metallohydrolase 2 [Sulfitobacter marinus]|uniref:Quinoprotein relay system zinc metallohydrolase 2 n=1 Tax=Sulfitobacter marinus TaxID=394264 RepID=A0A1I6SVD1_9RHOB|nr:quinoprotein relay system zinc metallohydrolase 2 [Sulfitobacter marinus]SFS80862.1 quinoprotein relay system zinc metallohydrolase 2 [Sulfitobacter marinus]
MFEAVVSLCLTLSDGPCRDQLLSGHEAMTREACIASLAASAPSLGSFDGLGVLGDPTCKPMAEPLEVAEVAAGVFVHMGLIEEPSKTNRGDVSNLGFIIGTHGVAVIDTGAARWTGEALWRAIRLRTDRPVTHVVLTHMHPDHALGAAPFSEAGAQIIGHANLPRALSDRQANYLESLERLIGSEQFLGTQAVPIDQVVQDRLDIDLGGRVLELRAWPVAHTAADFTVLDQNTKTLFAGDLIFHRHIPALDGSLNGWQAVLAELQKMELTRLIPGHGGPALDWPGGLAGMKSYLNALETDTRAAISEGARLGEAVEIIAQSQAAHWELFDAYNPRNATAAFTELEWED